MKLPSLPTSSQRSIYAALLIIPASALLNSCSGIHRTTSLHAKGERVINARAFAASPLVGDALVWRGGGDIPNYGIGVQGYKFYTDRLAIGAGFNVMNFNTPGSDVRGAEIEGRMRYYVAEYDKVGLFLDLNGGGMWTQDSIPQRGTEWNYTFSFGPGLEVPLDENRSILLGAEFHHMSNADGQNSPRNPSQNEMLYWLGHSWKF